MSALWLQLPSYRRPIQPKKRRRIPAMSAKRRAESVTYRRLRVEFLEAHSSCQRCGRKADCVHHWAGRGRNYLKVNTWRASCTACNEFAKQHPAAAREENWIAPIGVYAVG